MLHNNNSSGLTTAAADADEDTGYDASATRNNIGEIRSS